MAGMAIRSVAAVVAMSKVGCRDVLAVRFWRLILLVASYALSIREGAIGECFLRCTAQAPPVEGCTSTGFRAPRGVIVSSSSWAAMVCKYQRWLAITARSRWSKGS